MVKKVAPVFLLLFYFQSMAQTYPFAEGFEGLPNTQVPAGWGGSMKVLQNHGINDLKALCARVSSAVTVDSSITPLIGPLTSSSVLSFYYRIIDQANYPSTPTNLDAGDSIEVLLSTDSINYQTVFLIDMNNHNPSFNFIKKKIYLSQFAGNDVNFKIRCHYKTGPSFFVDIDTLLVKNDAPSSIDNLISSESFSLFPNPCPKSNVCQLRITEPENTDIKVFNSMGQTILIMPSNNVNTIPTNGFASGIYFVQVGNTVRKLVIE